MSNAHWIARDRPHLWHPCTQMHDHEFLPLTPIVRAEGVWLEDADGKRYLDAISSWWTNLFGHRHPAIVAALKAQLDQLDHVIFAGFTHPPAIELAERLVRLTAMDLPRVFLADSGSAAVEVALKMSVQYWRNVGQPERHRFINLVGSYHGETLGALGVGDMGLYRDVFRPILHEPMTVASPAAFDDPDGDAKRAAARALTDLERALETQRSTIAAVIVEPLVQCAAGMRMHDPSYLIGLRALCDRFDVHLIADEIAVGFGRTGSLFACHQGGIAPDFLCLSKGLTGGTLPLSAMLTSERIYAAFYDRYETLRGFMHSHSYTGNPLGCAAANATLGLIESLDIVRSNAPKIAALKRALDPLRAHPHVIDVRQTGMIGAVELGPQRGVREGYPWTERRGLKVYLHGLENGVLLRPLGNVIYFMPPYVIEPAEIARMVAIAADGIDRATRGGS
jgi:adenosylmethionine---8-amino-7-oxononanoate aminotransferase